MQKKRIKSVGIIVLLAVIIVGWGISKYNKLVNLQESVNTSWANVETQYQRRADLIPNLVNTVKGYAKHEQETFEAVVNARAKATQTTVDIDNLDEASLKKFQEAQGEVTSALSRLIAVQENYPDLKANENFKELQAQLEGTENRINEARKSFNGTTREYNVAVRVFPGNIIAGIFGFQQKPLFQAAEGADKAPTVSFD